MPEYNDHYCRECDNVYITDAAWKKHLETTHPKQFKKKH